MPNSHFSRRQFLKLTAAGIFSGSALHSRSVCSAAVAYAGLKSADYLGEPKIVASVTTEKVFTEGPACDGKGSVYFTDVAGQVIHRYDEKTGKLSAFRYDTNAANGLEFDAKGNLLVCEGGRDEIGSVVRIDLPSENLTTLASRYQNHWLGAPNDLVVDKQGRIYFTSRLANTNPQAGNVNSVYRIDPDGKLTRILAAPEIDMPNGIEISPDGKKLYLVESDGRENRARCIRRYDLNPDGSVSNGDVLIDFYPGRSGDGMCVDAEGNLYIAAGLHATRKTSETLDTKPGIHVVTPAGKLVAFVQTPEDTITNCCFGGKDGKTLYVTCGRHLIAIPSKRPGSRFVS